MKTGRIVHYYDHGLLGATLAVSSGATRRLGRGCVLLAALISMTPDWDALAKHVSAESYEAVHRVWGHNVFVVGLLGAALGTLGWWIQCSAERRTPHRPGATSRSGSDLAVWLALGASIMLSHVLMDVLYCGGFDGPTWPVQLFWPVTSMGFAYPCVTWTDWPTTCILSAGLLGCLLFRRHTRLVGCGTLGVLTAYVLCHRIWGV